MKAASRNRETISLAADALNSTKNAVEMYMSRDSWVTDKFHTCLRMAFVIGYEYRKLTEEDWSTDADD